MELPGNSIGITDMLGYRDCAARMAYGMRRHIGEGKQSDAMTPEGGSPAAAYGSCLHDVVALTEERVSDATGLADYMEILECDPCCYCGGEAGVIDHVEPLRFGGSGDWDNLTAACKPCNSRKGARKMLVFLAG